ncbi:class I SAM-dependent methyltransferase [Streptomyces sp. NPDC020681]|uniref:class I SAM-dependent methyltransferase n=1 Tax=Streptomyces sp. NPDC020681 TaxID=3365083 RepID=UPI003793F3A6
MPETNETLHDRFIELSGPPERGRVVDLRCGAGPALTAFARRFPRAHLMGFDRSEEALDTARERLQHHSGIVELASVDLREQLPLAEASVDAVISSNLLECLPDPAQLLKEIWRVLLPGGAVPFRLRRDRDLRCPCRPGPPGRPRLRRRGSTVDG